MHIPFDTNAPRISAIPARRHQPLQTNATAQNEGRRRFQGHKILFSFPIQPTCHSVCLSAGTSSFEAESEVHFFQPVFESTLMTLHDRIESNPKIMLGKPVIRGTRITVELVLRKIAEGADEQAILSAYPNLIHDDIMAAVRYAADTLAHEEVLLASVAR
jgi:uncharacterized protein (DUF433 family)